MKFRSAVTILISAALGAVLLIIPAKADIEDLTVDTGCSDLPSYNAELIITTGEYDVYARLAKRGEQANMQGFSQLSGNYGDCQAYDEIKISGDRWTKIGVFSATEEQDYVFQLSSYALAGLPDANRPAIMLVPHNNPVCVPNVECDVQVDGKPGYVRPPGTLLNQNSLHVLEVKDPSKDMVRTVRYYVDDAYAYSTASLKTFDMRYVSYQEQKLTRVIEYASGQQVVLDDKAPLTHADNFGNFLFRLSKTYPQAVNVSMWGGGVLVVLAVALGVIRLIQRRRDWQYHHGFIRKERKVLTAKQRRYEEIGFQVVKILRWSTASLAVVAGVAALIVLTNTFVLQIFTVDGVSMEKTLANGSQTLINKIPKTIADINGTEYVPKRGQVVVVKGVFGNHTYNQQNEANLYLIKRVIGLPGERVVIKDGIITIYNKEHPEGFNPDKGSSWEKTMRANVKTEQLDIQLGIRELFVSGDNRPESIDSRFNGPLTTNEVVGTMLANF